MQRVDDFAIEKGISTFVVEKKVLGTYSSFVLIFTGLVVKLGGEQRTLYLKNKYVNSTKPNMQKVVMHLTGGLVVKGTTTFSDLSLLTNQPTVTLTDVEINSFGVISTTSQKTFERKDIQTIRPFAPKMALVTDSNDETKQVTVDLDMKPSDIEGVFNNAIQQNFSINDIMYILHYNLVSTFKKHDIEGDHIISACFEHFLNIADALRFKAALTNKTADVKFVSKNLLFDIKQLDSTYNCYGNQIEFKAVAEKCGNEVAECCTEEFFNICVRVTSELDSEEKQYQAILELLINKHDGVFYYTEAAKHIADKMSIECCIQMSLANVPIIASIAYVLTRHINKLKSLS